MERNKLRREIKKAVRKCACLKTLRPSVMHARSYERGSRNYMHPHIRPYIHPYIHTICFKDPLKADSHAISTAYCVCVDACLR
jgi:hypothetical protein